MKNTQELNEKVRENYIVPAVDIYENNDEYVLKAEMPGVSKENVEVLYEKDYLEIIGRVDLEFEENLKVIDREWRLSDYYRRFKVDNSIDRDNTKAIVENGVLTITIGKNEEVKPRKIEITTE